MISLRKLLFRGVPLTRAKSNKFYNNKDVVCPTTIKLKPKQQLLEINAAIKVASQKRDIDEVLKAIKNLKENESLKPNLSTYVNLIDAFSNLKNKRSVYAWAKKLQNSMQEDRMQPDIITFRTGNHIDDALKALVIRAFGVTKDVRMLKKWEEKLTDWDRDNTTSKIDEDMVVELIEAYKRTNEREDCVKWIDYSIVHDKPIGLKLCATCLSAIASLGLPGKGEVWSKLLEESINKPDLKLLDTYFPELFKAFATLNDEENLLKYVQKMEEKHKLPPASLIVHAIKAFSIVGNKEHVYKWIGIIEKKEAKHIVDCTDSELVFEDYKQIVNSLRNIKDFNALEHWVKKKQAFAAANNLNEAGHKISKTADETLLAESLD